MSQTTSHDGDRTDLWRNPRTWGIAGICALVLAVGYQVWIGLDTDQFVELFPETSLSDAELNACTIAFSKEGLNDYRLEKDRLWVPLPDRDQYLKAVDQHGAAPPYFNTRATSPPPWTPSAERNRQQNQQRVRRMTAMLRELPFVDHVMVEFDEQKTGGLRPTHQRTAVIAVRKPDAQVLDELEVASMLKVLQSGIAGLEPGSITVTDLNSGMSFSPEELDRNGDLKRRMALSARRTRVQKYLQRAFADFPGIEIQVSERVVDPNCATAVSAAEGLLNSVAKSSPSENSVPTNPSSSGRSHTPLAASANQAYRVRTPQDAAATGTGHASANFETGAEASCCWEVALKLPASLIRSNQPQGTADSVGNIPRPLQKMVAGRLEKAASELQGGGDRIDLLATRMMISESEPDIRKNETARSVWGGSGFLPLPLADGWLGWPLIVAGAIGIALIYFAWPARRRDFASARSSANANALQPRSSTRTRPLDPETVQARNAEPRPQRSEPQGMANSASTHSNLQPEIVELIRNNPQQAAEILKSWMKDAA